MRSTEFPPRAPSQMDREHRKTLLDLARRVINHGVDSAECLEVDPEQFHPLLQEPQGTFVTLYRDARLRGCIGSLEAHRTLVEDLAHNAFAAAFSDPRFAPCGPAELEELTIEIAILSPLQAIAPADEAALLEALEPHQHGLLIEDAGHRATFLPKVWQSLPDKQEFLKQLRLKAGLPGDHWSASLRASIYSTLVFSD